MISELVKYYIFDRLDKQILNRIPYCLLFSLIIYLLIIYLSFSIEGVILYFLICSLFTVLISTSLFNWYVNRNLESLLTNVDLKKFTEKMSMIVEDRNSLLEDIKNSENWWIIIIAIVSGLSFFSLFTSAFLIVLNYFKISKDLIAVAIIFVTIYLYQDIAKSGLFEESKASETKFPFLLDLLEMYTINNSLRYLPAKRVLSEAFIQFLSRIAGPLTYLSFPKLSFDMLLIYWNHEVVKLLKRLTKKDNNSHIRLKHEAGQSVDEFFTKGSCEKITVLNEKSPKEVFPYLFNPSYSYSEKERKKWVAFRMLERGLKNEKTVGYIFIHLFEGVFVKRRVKNIARQPVKIECKAKPVLLFIFIGERSYTQYIKTEIEVISTKIPREIMEYET